MLLGSTLLAVGVSASLPVTRLGKTASANTPVLSIGKREISERQLERNLRRLKGLSPDDHSPLAPVADTQRALERYLVEQVLTAAAFAQGFAERPEMRVLEPRLERYRLTHPSGPLYAALGLSMTSLREDQISDWIEELRHARNLTIVRFPESAPIAEVVREFQAAGNTGLSDEIVTLARDSGQARVHQGILTWPYAGFESAGDFLPTAPIGRWSQYQAADGTCYHVLVRGHETRALPRVAGEEAGFRRSIARLGTQAGYLKRRAVLIASAQLSFDWTFAPALLADIRNHADRDDLIVVESLRGMGAHRLAAFHADGSEIVLTAMDFAVRFNARMLRRLPASEFELYETVREMVQEELDYREACVRGLPADPHFREDHESLFASQVLGLFEQEVVRPSITIEAAAIERYYDENRREFSQAEWVSGRLYGFDDPRIAAAFARAPLRPEGSWAHPAGATSTARLRLTSPTDLPGWPGPADIPFRFNAPAALGPYPRGSQAMVWVRDEHGPAVPQPLAEVRAEIRNRLREAKLPQAEAELARQWGEALVVSDRIAYSRYAPGTIQKPW
jgi:hypothetical protein